MTRLLVVAAMILTLGGCGDVLIGVRGSGEMTTEDREVSDFSEIVLEGSGVVRVDVDGTESLTIEAEENLIDRLTSEVDDGRLILGTRGPINPTEEIVYTVTAASLEGVTISGSGHVEGDDITADVFTTEIEGSGTIELGDLDFDRVIADVSGSGNIDLSGSASSIEVSIPGSGTFAGEDMEAVTATVSISGSGAAVVNVSDTLDATVSGSGVIEYVGNPVVESTISGSGSIRPR